MVDIALLRQRNAQRWQGMIPTRNFLSVAKALVDIKAKARYQAVEAKTGVPWFIIAVIHEREASQRWDTQLGQGDPLNKVSVHVPRGRGPFNSWEEGAFDALMNTSPYAGRNKDWSIGSALTLLEEYNGLGYASMGRPSPYIWAGTNQYVSGKYVRDGVFDPNVVDSQLGCAGLIKAMMSLDASIKFGAPQSSPPTTNIPSATTQIKVQPTITAASSAVIAPKVVPRPEITNNLFGWIASWFRRP